MENTLETLGTSNDGTISYVRLSSDRLEEALKILEDHFYPYECVSIGSNVAKNPKAVQELNLLATECIQDGVSIAAVDIKSNTIIGVSVNKIQENHSKPGETYFEKFTQEKCKEKESTSFMNTMIYCDSIINLFDYLKVDKVLEIMFITVSTEHRRRGVATDLIKYDLQLLEKLMENDNGPKAAVALFSSTYSQKVGEKLDFEVVATINYKVLKYDGVKFSDKIDSKHPTIKVVVKKFMKDVDLSETCSRV